MKKALVIGNNAYRVDEQKLSNPINDAKALEEILSYKGFDVTCCTDLNELDMRTAFSKFSDTVNEGDDVIFFFAGHAIEDRDTNYLFSIDYDTAFDLDKSLTVDKIQNELFVKNSTGLKLIIIDACRNNPVYADSPIPKKSKANKNTLIAFSTSSGNKAKDGKGDNSLYTYNLVKNIESYGLSINDIFSKTRDAVVNATQFSQIPWEYSSLTGTNQFTFDNVKVPNKLKRIIKSRFNVTYSTTNFNGVFYSVGESNNFDMFDVNSSIAQKLESKLIEDGGSIEKIASNNSVIAFVSDSGQFGAINLETGRLTSSELGNSLYAVCINDNGIAVLGGAFDKLTLIDINLSESYEVDIKNDVLRHMYNDDDQLDYASSSLTVMTTCFSKINHNIFAFGGSESVLTVMDLVQKKIIFLNEQKEQFSYTYCIDFSSDGKYMVSSHESGMVNLWCAKTYNVIHCFHMNENISKNEFFEFKEESHCNHMHHVRFTPNSEAFAVSTSESQVLFFDVCKKTLIDKIDLNIEPFDIYSFEFDSSGDEMVISVGNKKYLLTS
ncbi:hypothetical protein GNP80_05575 [Aliivibrio fischeri]|uniref:caspase family protein n=1 Tax=Aliivibrio fischeri TaxID=668 RepID=UPI0012D9DDB0|nr:caspase family protein [Aliivibrio fischeri]MUK91905.1 hypothetical protein [Aliivibrio fischeri]